MKKNIFLLLLLTLVFPNAKLKSLILPGWGELSINKQERGKYFFYAESRLILSAYSSQYETLPAPFIITMLYYSLLISI